jgi:hypothetical protein
LTSDAGQRKQPVSNWQTKPQSTATANTCLGCSTQYLFLPSERESPDSSSSRSSKEVISVRSALEGQGTTTDFDELVCPAVQQHNDGGSPVWPTSMRRPYVVLATSECRSVYAPVLPPRDEALHQESNLCQHRLAFETNLIHPSQSQNCSAVSSNESDHGVNVDHGHCSQVVPPSGDELLSVTRPASANMPPSGCERPALRRGGLLEGMQQHQAANDILLVDSCLGSSSTAQGPNEERQASIRAYKETEKRPSSRRGPIRVQSSLSLGPKATRQGTKGRRDLRQSCPTTQASHACLPSAQEARFTASLGAKAKSKRTLLEEEYLGRRRQQEKSCPFRCCELRGLAAWQSGSEMH